jgi:predicted nucleic acid-binding Zn ribbon protein
MPYLVGVLCGLMLLVALPQRVAAQAGEEAVPKVALAIYTQHRLPPQLMLRASYYLYLDADADNGATSDQTEPNAEEPKSAQADGEVATSESNLEEPVSSPAPGTEVPDIDTLSQTAIERHEIQSAQRTEEKKTHERRRRRALAIGVSIALAVVFVAVAGAATAASMD